MRSRPRTVPLRRFVVAALALIVAAWSLAHSVAVRVLVEQSYLEFEHQDGMVGAQRLDGFLRGELERLLQVARDWGYWNDTQRYIQGKQPEFADDNFDDNTFDNLEVDFLLLAGTDGTPVYQWRRSDADAYDADADASAADDFLRTFLAAPHGRSLLTEGREVTGLVTTPRGVMALAAVPILDNARTMPPAGVMVFARDINAGLLAQGKEHSVFDAEIFVPGGGPWPPDVAAQWAQRELGEQRTAVTTGGEQLGAYVMLRDLDGRTIGVLRSVLSRDTKQRFEAMARYLLGISLLLAMMLALAMVWVLEQRVLSPLATIGRVVSRVARHGDLDVRVPESEGRDELAQLGREVNLMLAEISAQQHLRAARDSALAASAQKSEFLANMSHEIRTPMNGILGMLELVLETELTGQQQERVRTAYRSAEGLLALLNDVLDFSKLEADKLVLEAREFDLRELVESVGTLYAPVCEQKGIEISCCVAPGLPRYKGDALRLRQILTNLVGNAVKFTDQGEITVEVEAGDAPDELRMVVADTGIGIVPERVALLFQPFTQVDASMARRYGGTGLGLAICRQLVERMHGSIRVASEPGQGTRFLCTLRLQPCAVVDVVAPPPYDGRRALVLGPGDGTRRAITTYLDALGLSVTQHLQSDALGELLPGDFDLFLFDDAHTDGAAAALRRQVTALGMPLLRLSNFNRSMSTHVTSSAREQILSKPVQFQKLHKAIDAAFQPAGAMRLAPAPPPVAGARFDVIEGKRVLLVEDNLVNQALALGMLETYELNVCCAESGTEALERLEAEAFDLVLMDCQMPEMDGLEVTRRWRALERARGTPRVPIVALTANAMAGDREACLAAGMDAYLAKPFTRAALTDAIRPWLLVADARRPVTIAAAATA